MSAPAAVASPVSERSKVLTQAVAEAARRLGVGTAVLGSVIGISQSSASRLLGGKYFLRESDKEWELAALFVRLYRGLASIVGNSDELARLWLESANAAFGGREPLAVIRRVDGLVHACEYVDAHRAPV